MENKFPLLRIRPNRKWLRLGITLLTAFFLSVIILLLPVAKDLTVRLPALQFSQGRVIEITLPLGPGSVYAQQGITITKVAAPANFVDQGGLITYTISIINVSAGPLSIILVRDSLPSQTTCQAVFESTDSSGGTWGAQPCGSEARWAYTNFGDNPFDSQEAVQLQYRVLVNKPLRDQVDKITNAAGTYSLQADSVIIVEGSRTVMNTVNAPNWQITKSVDPSPTVEPGEQLVYTISALNDGHLETEGAYTITDQIPQFTTFDSASDGGTFDGTNVTWVFSDVLGIGQPKSVIYTVTVQNPLTNAISIVNDTYSVTGGTVFAPDSGDPITVTVDSPVTITLTKADDPDPVPAGDLLAYNFTITNDPASKGPASDVVVTDNVPANTTLVDAIINGGVPGLVTTSSLTVTWQLTDPIQVGDSVGLTMLVRVNSPLPNGTIISNNFSEDYNLSVSNNFSFAPTPPDVTTTVVSTPELRLVKSATPTPTIEAGDRLTYTIAFSNTGNADATNVIITDTLSNAVIYEADSAGGVHDGSPQGGNIVWNIGTLDGEGAESGLITVTVTVSSPLANGTLIPNTVVIDTAENVGQSDTITTIVTSRPELDIIKSVTPTPTVEAGDLLTYTLLVSNEGNANAQQVEISDVIPLNTSFVSATPGFSPASPLPGAPITWLTSTVLVGSPQIYNFVVRADNPLDNGTIITNSATVSSVLDFDESNTVTTVVVSTPTLEIFKAGLPEPVPAGGLLTYTIRYTNTGNANANNVVITDIFPANTSFNNDDSNPFVPGSNITGGRIWDIGAVPGNGGGGVITLTLNVAAPQDNGTILENVVTIKGIEPTQDVYTTTNTITSTPIIEITKRESADPIKAGGQVVYTLRYTNTGNMDATGVVITDVYQGVFVAIQASPPGVVQLTPAPPRVRWNIGALPADSVGRTQVVTVTLPKSVLDGTTVQNTALIDNDQNLDDSQTITTTITGLVADLSVNKARAGSGQLVAGNRITYTITITNAGPDTVDATLVDTFIPAQASFVSCLPICNSSTPGTVIWTFTNFTGTQTVNLVLQVAPSFSGLFINEVEVNPTSPADEDPNLGNNNDDESTSVRLPTANLVIDKRRVGAGPVIAGGLVVYEIDVTNLGPDTVNAVVTDTFNLAAASLVSCGGCTGAGPVVWTLNSFTGTQTLGPLVLETSPFFSGTLINSAEITTTTQFADDPNLNNNVDNVSTTVRFPQVELQVSKQRVGTGEVIAGGLITYTITVTNTGPETVDAVLTDTFNLGEASFVSCSGGCSGTGPVTWNFANFGGPQTVSLVLQSSPAFSGTLVNTAVITSAVPSIDSNLANNEDSADTPVRFPIADLQIRKTTNQTQVDDGDLITYTIVVTNTGPDTVNATVTDTFNTSAATLVNCSPACNGAGPVSWTLNSFTGTQTLNLILRTSFGFSGTFTNNIEVDFIGIGIDNDLPTNSDSASTTVIFIPKMIYLPVIFKSFPDLSTPTPTVTPTVPGGTPATGTPTATPTVPGGTPPANQGDLTIIDFFISPANPTATDNVVVTIVLQNQGTVSTGEGFWTDFYVNPAQLPSNPALGRDRRWNNPAINSLAGIAWQVPALSPGQTVTLTSDGSVGLAPDPGQTQWTARLDPGNYSLYAFVDSFDANDPTGPTYVEIVEPNENNNLAGPLTPVVAGDSGQPGLDGDSADVVELEPRADAGSEN